MQCAVWMSCAIPHLDSVRATPNAIPAATPHRLFYTCLAMAMAMTSSDDAQAPQVLQVLQAPCLGSESRREQSSSIAAIGHDAIKGRTRK